jgi:hypothetical protein
MAASVRRITNWALRCRTVAPGASRMTALSRCRACLAYSAASDPTIKHPHEIDPVSQFKGVEELIEPGKKVIQTPDTLDAGGPANVSDLVDRKGPACLG